MNYDIIIIGAGIVGLASALKILESRPNLKLLIIEKEDQICKHQTGNNSGVIHSGIYYKPGSLKAINCRKGYKLLLKFCEQYEVNFDVCGKVIVATSEKETEYLNSIFDRGIENGLTGLRKISMAELKEIEPNVKGDAGVFVPQTGIIDFTEVALKIVDEIKKYDVELIFGEEVRSITKSLGIIDVVTSKKNYGTKYLVSCAGLYSDKIAKMTNPDLDIQIIPFRGEYYKLKKEKRSLVKSLIYPVPNPSFPFLGVHFTRMIDGEVEAGPNAVLSFKREGYNKFSFNIQDTLETFFYPGFFNIAKKYWKTGIGEFYRSFSKKAFVRVLRKLIPEINEEDLIPGGAGVRAQACDINGKLLDDFYFVENENVVHVCNAPSPAATSSLSIGETVADKIIAKMN